MAHNYTAVIKQDAGWWIGWLEEVPGGELSRTHQRGLA
jgi:hypothetical protein